MVSTWKSYKLKSKFNHWILKCLQIDPSSIWPINKIHRFSMEFFFCLFFPLKKENKKKLHEGWFKDKNKWNWNRCDKNEFDCRNKRKKKTEWKEVKESHFQSIDINGDKWPLRKTSNKSPIGNFLSFNKMFIFFLFCSSNSSSLQNWIAVSVVCFTRFFFF